MTNEDALFFLTRFRTQGINEHLYDALGVAIEALKAQNAKPDEKAHQEQGESDKLGVKTGKTCADAISRQAAIDALSTPRGILYPIRTIEALPSVQPEPQWIPCSERLPERGKDVLVTRDYDGRDDNNKSCRYVEVASCYGEDDDITWSSFSDEYKIKPRNHHVVAWMPLPEPYREGEQDEQIGRC